jgi:DNA-binding GntR family transcriptional regulator
MASKTSKTTRSKKLEGIQTEPPGLQGGDNIETRIYNTIFESVMSQRLTPGTKLPESTLCELFDVSRATVRKVLQKLAHNHIVDLHHNRGAVVAAPTPEEKHQIFEARRALEAAIVRLAATHAKRTDIAALRAQLKKEHEATHRLAQPEWSRLASSFHLQLVKITGNAILQSYLMELVSRCSLIVALYEAPGNATCEHDEHTRIVDCIEQGDAERAAQLMDDHLRSLESNIRIEPDDPNNSLARMLGLH